jgi:hypothetical protein
MNVIITFCGHRRIYDEIKIENDVMDVLKGIINQAPIEECFIFYCGGYGQFDGIAARVVQKLKLLYSERKIERIFVTPYIGGVNRNYDRSMIKEEDEVLYPPLENVPLKYAILRRNEWMVDHADIVIAYVAYSFGGAAKTFEYAKRKKKSIIEIR